MCAPEPYTCISPIDVAFSQMESSLSALDGDIAASRASLSALQAEEKAKLTKLEGVAMAYSTMVQNIDVYN